MNRSALLQLLTRYEARTCTPEECQLVEQWYELLGEPFEIPLTEDKWVAMEQKLWNHVKPRELDLHTAPEMLVKPMWRRFMLIASGMAAIIAIAFGLNMHLLPDWFGQKQSLIDKTDQTAWTQYQNETENPREVRLPDGSVIILSPHSQLAVHKAFNRQNRDVKLLGEADFHVHRDPARPFIVYSGDIVTKVLGTTFQVRAGDSGQPIQVTVKSGKVTVYRQAAKDLTNVSPNRGVILTPNQKATYYPDNKQFVTSISENPEPITASLTDNITPPSLEFLDTPIDEVIAQLEKIYGVEIELEQDSLRHCPFTGDLTRQALYTKLELLCGTINGSYEVRGTKILITGKGCQ